ncbi:hypothetical protein ACT3SP_04345 [Brachybacterium sp. AOP43-C2-M15]|uniref:hypothetical protein n=1 Tax=Brachybacterium sp. AOP43-C2-M15 TaxID=3457661 RepID=UPI0040332442
MDTSIRRFLVPFIVMVLSGATLILLLPGVIHERSAVPVWVLVLLGGIAVASALRARRVTPETTS